MSKLSNEYTSVVLSKDIGLDLWLPTSKRAIQTNMMQHHRRYFAYHDFSQCAQIPFHKNLIDWNSLIFRMHLLLWILNSVKTAKLLPNSDCSFCLLLNMWFFRSTHCRSFFNICVWKFSELCRTLIRSFAVVVWLNCQLGKTAD